MRPDKVSLGLEDEVFDMQMCLNPTFRNTSEQKWLTKRGVNTFSGVPAAHVGIRHPGQGIMEVHQQSVNGKVGWQKLPNENRAGIEPYALSYPENAKSQMESMDQDNVSDVGGAAYLIGWLC